MMHLDLTDRHALVCGGSQGIGRATAMQLAELGATVTVLARSAQSLMDVVAELPRRTPSSHHQWIAVDMANPAALDREVEKLVAEHPVHILINNTGGPPGGPANSAKPAEFQDAFTRHLLAGQTVLQRVLPGMKSAGYGRVINVISTSVKEPIRNLGVSNTIRGAVANWAKTLATELGPFGITVNNVLPGYTRTQRLEAILDDRVRVLGRSREDIAAGMLATVPVGRFADASEIANAIAFLASPAASYVNGINLPVDGGRTQSL